VAREEGAQVRTGTRVRRILTAHGLATGVELDSGEIVYADVVVGAADMHHIETALLDTQDQWRDEGSWKRKTPGVSALLAFIDVEGALPELAHHTLFFSRDWDANFDAITAKDLPPHPASIYVARTTATDSTAAPPGHEALVMLVPFPADASIGADAPSRAEATRQAHLYLEQAGAWAGVPDLASRARIVDLITPADFVTRVGAWQGSALGLEHTLKQSAMFRPGNQSRKVANLLYAGASTVPGVGVPICLISAELVVKRLMGDTSAAPTAGPLAPGFLATSRRRGALGEILAKSTGAA
jgi:phytoene desaturase